MITNPANYSVFAKDPELRAYLHQKLSVLQAFLTSERPISVIVEEHSATESKPASVEVQLWAETEYGELMSSFADASPYFAICQAAFHLERQIDALQNAMIDFKSRNQEIKSFGTGRTLLH